MGDFNCLFSPFPYPNMKRFYASFDINGKADFILADSPFNYRYIALPQGFLSH